MKIKSLAIIFIIFLLITLISGLVVFLSEQKEQPVLNGEDAVLNFGNQLLITEEAPAAAEKELASVAATATKPIVQPEKAAVSEVQGNQAELIQAVMLIDGTEYRIGIEPGDSVHDLMSALKNEKKIDFKGKNYSDLGFFVEEINGVKNNPSGKNWVYYINGQPAPVGASYYLIKAGDTIEWKYENKSF